MFPARMLPVGLLACLLVLAPLSAAAQGRASDAQIMQRASLAASGATVDVFSDGVRVDPTFLARAEETVRQLEALAVIRRVRWLGSDLQHRRAYDLASYRFVKYLVEKAGLETFMKLYDSMDPEAEIARLYGASRDQLVRMAGM